MWIQDDIAEKWKYSGMKKRGGQQQYSDVAIELCLIISKVYHLPLRQTQGFMNSFFEQRQLKIKVPDYTTISKRSGKLVVELSASGSKTITDIVVDSTGLKVYGEGEWKVRKHGAGKHRTWMKLHVAINETTQQIEAATLTTNSVDDACEAETLLHQINKPIRTFKADGAYDKHKVRKELHKRKIQQIIPPQHNAVVSKTTRPYFQSRDQAIETIKKTSRSEWKKQNGYHHRSKVETTMFRYKTIIGNRLSARNIENQITEAKIGCIILNMALKTIKPKSYKV